MSKVSAQCVAHSTYCLLFQRTDGKVQRYGKELFRAQPCDPENPDSQDISPRQAYQNALSRARNVNRNRGLEGGPRVFVGRLDRLTWNEDRTVKEIRR